MTYGQALRFLEGLGRFGIRLGTANMDRLLERLGRPERGIRFLHVAGSNGKGSTCRFLSALLAGHGYRVGLYLSPHLLDTRERVQVGNRMISRRDFAGLAGEIAPQVREQSEFAPHSLTYFEVMTALAFLHFHRCRVDFAVIETGLGGRLDATNLINPLVSVITPIGLEHCRFLGRTLPLIAAEKAGIIKSGRPVVTSPQRPSVARVIAEKARASGSPLYAVGRHASFEVESGSGSGTVFSVRLEPGPGMTGASFNGLKIPLAGEYQAQNATTACLAAGAAGIALHPRRVRASLASVRWPGRLEVLGTRPLVVFDVSHNLPALRVMVENLEKIYPERRKHFVFGVLSDKDYRAMLGFLGRHGAGFHFTRPDSGRAREPADLAAAFAQLFPDGPPARVVSDPGQAIAAALGGPAAAEDAMLCVCGSFYLARAAAAFRARPDRSR